jgi:Dyp-type peroxidase family
MTLEEQDIQAVVLRPRPAPYCGRYIVLRVDDARQGREMLRRLTPHIATSDHWWEPKLSAWIGIVFTYSGLKAMGLSREILDSFPEEFREGMSARADVLGDYAFNAPENWEQPFGTSDVHIALAVYAKDENSLKLMLDQAEESRRTLSDIHIIYSMDFNSLPEGRNPFGFRDGLHNPMIEGVSSAAYPGYGKPIKAGEFLMGYADELGHTATRPGPEALRKNSTFVVIRKFHTDVAAFRRFLRDNSHSKYEEELLAARMVGRWRNGAPLVLSPDHDDVELGSDMHRNNDFSYADDMDGRKCPFSSHLRRMNPRDALKDELVNVDLHHFLRRGTNYGSPLPEGIYDDDGQERGGVFLFIGAHIRRQFEFIQAQWISDGNFIDHGKEQDPLIGNPGGGGTFTIPQRPVRRRLQGLPQFVTVRGGEYCYLPSMTALRWIAEGNGADR